MMWTLGPLRSLAILVIVAVQSIAAMAASVAEPRIASWDALVPAIEPFDDPFLDMPLEHKQDLRDILRAEEAQSVGRSSRALESAAHAARSRLEAAGLDADHLLEQRLVVMERRREVAAGVSSTFLDQEIVLDGYVLPLTWQGDRVTEFLLVPWIGACIHTPPPPSNQIIFVSVPDGLALERRYQAVRLAGTLRHRPTEHALFLIDGSAKILASYGLESAAIAGQPSLPRWRSHPLIRRM